MIELIKQYLKGMTGNKFSDAELDQHAAELVKLILRNQADDEEKVVEEEKPPEGDEQSYTVRLSIPTTYEVQAVDIGDAMFQAKEQAKEIIDNSAPPIVDMGESNNDSPIN